MRVIRIILNLHLFFIGVMLVYDLVCGYIDVKEKSGYSENSMVLVEFDVDCEREGRVATTGGRHTIKYRVFLKNDLGEVVDISAKPYLGNYPFTMCIFGDAFSVLPYYKYIDEDQAEVNVLKMGSGDSYLGKSNPIYTALSLLVIILMMLAINFFFKKWNKNEKTSK